MMNRLIPTYTGRQIYPPNVAYMARTNMHEIRMVGYTEPMLDRATSFFMGIFNDMPTVRHEACAGNEVIDLFSRAGIHVNEDTHVYRTEHEAKNHALKLIESGHKLIWPYCLPADDYPDSAHLVSTELYRHLNSKENMGKMVSSEHLAFRKIIDHEMLADFQWSTPVCLKAAGVPITGWGYTVFPCFNQKDLDAAKTWFAQHRDDIPAIILEEWLDLQACWCVSLIIRETEIVCMGGVEQLFSAPGKQSGSILDPNMKFPDEGKTVAIQACEYARKMGYRGIAGLDIGITMNGRIIFFDPNFRFASSTPHLLFHPAAAERSGLPVSLSFQIEPNGPFEQIAKKLHQPIDEAWFVPTRFFNGDKHPLCEGKHTVTGMVMGADRESAHQASKKLEVLLLGNA